MEYLNRQVKGALSNVGSNISCKVSVERAKKCLKDLIDIETNYNKVTGVPVPSGFHTFQKIFSSWLKSCKHAKLFPLL